MTDWIKCPKCGALMIGLTGGHICPLCGYRVPPRTITAGSGTSLTNTMFADDITFCLARCKTPCFRQPENIVDRTIPHSYADFSTTCSAYNPDTEGEYE